MVVQHNMQAMNANRMLGITTKSQSKATEKLSSGYRINRAADDAAGLSISEKMRKQIKGLDQASTNAQDGISSVQTAEGALGEVHAMLQRMNELAVQAANGTNAESDRQSIQNEIEQLTTEIDRVAETTKFNETYLLKGNGKESSIKINAKDAGIEGALTGVGTGLATFKMDELKTGEQITIGSKGYTIGTGITEVREEVEKLETGKKMTINGTEYEVVDAGQTDPASKKYTKTEIAGMISDGDKVVIGSSSYVAMVDGTGATKAEAEDYIKELAVGDKVTIDGTEYTVAENGTAVAPQAAQNAVTTGSAASIKTIASAETTGTVSVTKTTKITQSDATNDALKNAIAALEDGSTVTANGVVYTIDNTNGTTPNLAGTAQSVKATDLSNADFGNAASTNFKGNEITIVSKKDYDVATQKTAMETAIDGLATGDTVEVGTETYTVGDGEAKAAVAQQAAVQTGTAESIAALLADNEEFTVKKAGETTGTTVKLGETILNDDGVGDNDASIISANQAYKLIADELLKASSVGCDPGSEAKAVDENGVEIAVGENAFEIDEENDTVIFNIQEATVVAKQGLQFTLHVGADADESNKIALTIDAMDAAGLGIKNMNVVDNTGAKATYAIDSIADAIAKVSAQRSELGAIQNRLEHTIANLDNVVENTTAAESAIRDTDMAEQMVEYSKNNILMQAGQSMLAQANQSTQGVLSLLQ